MNEEIKRDWLAEIRSGKYQQGRGVLHNREEDTYCCLGVLCELAVKQGVAVKEGWNAYTGALISAYSKPGAIEHSTAILPEVVMEWAGLDSQNPDLVGSFGLVNEDEREGTSSLGYLNDHGKNFEEIADIIEEHL